MTVEKDFGNDHYNELEIGGYPILEKIVVRKNALQHVKSLKISNNQLLKSIQIENGDEFEGNEYGALCYVKSLILDSIHCFPVISRSSKPRIN